MEIPNLRAIQVAKITGEGQNMNQGSINPLTLIPNKRDDKRKIKQSKKEELVYGFLVHVLSLRKIIVFIERGEQHVTYWLVQQRNEMSLLCTVCLYPQ